jgi:hypothetical protein
MPITLAERRSRTRRAKKIFDPNGNTAAGKKHPVVAGFCNQDSIEKAHAIFAWAFFVRRFCRGFQRWGLLPFLATTLS